jgi:hypothetical protein
MPICRAGLGAVPSNPRDFGEFARDLALAFGGAAAGGSSLLSYKAWLVVVEFSSLSNHEKMQTRFKVSARVDFNLCSILYDMRKPRGRPFNRVVHSSPAPIKVYQFSQFSVIQYFCKT